MAERIVALSGKGGTGKTALCAGVASALAEAGKKVLCIDCDVGLRNLDLFLGMSQAGALSFVEVSQGSYSLEQAARHPAYPTLSFLTAPVQQDTPIDPVAFGRFLEQADSQFDYVLLDAPSGLGSVFALAVEYANRAMLVTAADPAAMRDAGRTGQLLELMGLKQVRLVFNRVERRTLHSLGLTLDDMMDQIGLPLLGAVPEDSAVTLCAARDQALLTQQKRGAARVLRNIALRIQGQSVPLAIHL